MRRSPRQSVATMGIVEAANTNPDAEGYDAETYNPWTVVNLVFHHLVDQGLRPTLGGNGDPGMHAAAMLRTFGIQPAAEGNRRLLVNTQEELAQLRASMLGEP